MYDFEVWGDTLIYTYDISEDAVKFPIFFLVALDLETGKVRWKIKDASLSHLDAGLAVVYIEGVHSVIELKTGRVLWKIPREQRDPQCARYNDLHAFSDDEVATILDGKYFALLDKHSGKVESQWEAPTWVSTLKIDGKLVYLMDAGDNLYCHEVGTGRALWMRSPPPTPPGLCSDPLIVCRDTLILCADHEDFHTIRLLALDKMSGELLWSKVVQGKRRYAFASEEIFYAPDNTALNVRTGEVLKKLPEEASSYRAVACGRHLWYRNASDSLSRLTIEEDRAP
jgi:outer membrane protein assembly factor BamB